MPAYPTLDPQAALVLKQLAQQIAHEEELEYVGTEHVLLALLRHASGLAHTVLTEMGLGASQVIDTLRDLRKQDLEDTWVFGRLPGSPHYRNVLAIAIDEATQLEARQIGTEHLLLALLREKDSTAQRVLAARGVTLRGARDRVLRHLSSA